MPDKQPSVFDYTNFRVFLGDVYQWRKQKKHGFSYRAFSKLGGFASPNFLKLVIDGVRNLSPLAATRLASNLSLTGAAAQYFTTLVQWNQAESDKEREELVSRLQALLPYAKKRTLEPQAYAYLSHWLYPVLREMIALPGFQEEPHWISRRLTGRASVREITQALNFLLQENFIRRDSSGALVANDNVVLSSDEVKSLAIRNYHRQMLTQAQSMLEALSLQEREFGALTFNLPSTALGSLKEKMKTFRREIHEWALSQTVEHSQDVVIQLNMHMYPHTRAANRDEEAS